ncbi:hypothetical protein QR680_001384 [Steinernema hermaphroditum]|uniref:G-patch domain-containing protein n=1 Tax=Steinernema hermaphroditum TaxID=289476 RepID=A0AA39GY22_9BILA|nr:hypothetical protein QR680_001384 [Steinernema hermaphroditum]
MCAAAEGKLEAVKFIIANGANTKLCDSNGRSAESLAAMFRHYDVRECLTNLRMQTRSDNSLKRTGSAAVDLKNCSDCGSSYTDEAHFSSIVHIISTSKPIEAPGYSIPEWNIGYQMLQKTGWKETQGLGKCGEGKRYPSAKKASPSSSNVHDLTPKAKALKTEVRKAPQKQQMVQLPQHYIHSVQSPLQAAPIPQMPSLPTLPPPATVSFPTLATVTFPTVSLPTFPTFTMPPPFSQLISTKKPKKSSKRRKSAHKKKAKKQKPISEEYETEDLSSVGSRMPKYVKHEKPIAANDETPTWMVPYNKL